MEASALLQDPLERDRSVEATFRVADDISVIGSLEKGVTVYSQQVRAHNLMTPVISNTGGSKYTRRRPRATVKRNGSLVAVEGSWVEGFCLGRGRMALSAANWLGGGWYVFGTDSWHFVTKESR